ncbi:alpha/beta hydrolase [Actinophytocola sp.]|uniref:alpha/beta fold hydrolase n=1 Tax=Actinophytocola sp. TaxID=1872138 RepID=UPI002ED1F36E
MVTSKDGTMLAVDRVGTGPAVVCVGGALNDRRSTGWVAAHLTGFTTYSYDRRGRGDSGDTPPYAVEREIEDLAAVIEEAGGEAMVYGMSSGAVLALRAALAGVPITRLALYEPPLNAPATPPNHADRLAAAIDAGHPGEALELFLIEAVGVPPEHVAGIRQAPIWPAMEALAPTLRYDNAVMADGQLPAVSALTIPVTVLTGGASPTWMREAGRTLAKTLPNGTHEELPDQTHDVDPQTLARALRQAFA